VGRLYNRTVISTHSFAKGWKHQPSIIVTLKKKRHSLHKTKASNTIDVVKNNNNNHDQKQHDRFFLPSDQTNTEIVGETLLEFEDERNGDKRQHWLEKQETIIDTDNTMPRCQRELLVVSCHNENEIKAKTLMIPRKIVSENKRQRKEVTFAGVPILVARSDRINKVLCLDFLDAVTLSYFPPGFEYRTRNRHNIWYTRAEELTMKRQACIEDRIRRANSISKKGALVPPTTMAIGVRHRNRCQCRQQQKQKALDTVLQEQCQQRLMCRRIYGKIVPDTAGNHCSSGIIDPERLRKVYRSRGETIQSQKAAQARAQTCVLEQEHRDKEVCSDKDKDSDVHNDIDVNGFVDHYTNTTPIVYSSDDYDPEELLVEEELYPSRRTCSSQCSSECAMAFDNCIDCVFNTLLTPFLYSRKGAIFLDTGDELLVE